MVLRSFAAPYNRDLAPSDFYLFLKLKFYVPGKRFDDEDDVKRAVMKHFVDKHSAIILTSVINLNLLRRQLFLYN